MTQMEERKATQTMRDLGNYSGEIFNYPQADIERADKYLREKDPSGRYLRLEDAAWLWGLAKITWTREKKDETTRQVFAG